MKIKQAIKVSGININDIFKLPCIRAIEKGENQKPYAILYPSATEGRLTAEPGDIIAEFNNGMWQVFGQAAYDRLGWEQ